MRRYVLMLTTALMVMSLSFASVSIGFAARPSEAGSAIVGGLTPRDGIIHAVAGPTSLLPPVSEAQSSEITAQTVFSPDERIRITNTTVFPYNAVAYLEINDGTASCSGTFIGVRVVLTAAHCLYDADGGGWSRNIRVVPGKNGGSEPFGSQFGSVVRVPSGWRASVDAGRPNPQWDWGLVVLPNEELGKKVGRLPVGSLQTGTLKRADFNPVTGGYPGDKSRGTLWATSKPALIDALPDYLVSDLDSYPGQSGSAVWRGSDGMIVGIVTFGLAIPGLNYNFATRVENQFLADILDGCKRMGCSFDYYVEPSAPAAPTPPPPAAPPGATGRVPGFILLAHGEGATPDSDFKFSIGKRDSGALEGWLIWAPRADGHVQNVTLGSVDGAGGAASMWGTAPFQGARWTFNLAVSSRAATLTLHRPNGAVYATWGGPVMGGSIRVAGP